MACSQWGACRLAPLAASLHLLQVSKELFNSRTIMVMISGRGHKITDQPKPSNLPNKLNGKMSDGQHSTYNIQRTGW